MSKSVLSVLAAVLLPALAAAQERAVEAPRAAVPIALPSISPIAPVTGLEIPFAPFNSIDGPVAPSLSLNPSAVPAAAAQAVRKDSPLQAAVAVQAARQAEPASVPAKPVAAASPRAQARALASVSGAAARSRVSPLSRFAPRLAAASAVLAAPARAIAQTAAADPRAAAAASPLVARPGLLFALVVLLTLVLFLQPSASGKPALFNRTAALGAVGGLALYTGAGAGAARLLGASERAAAVAGLGLGLLAAGTRTLALLGPAAAVAAFAANAVIAAWVASGKIRPGLGGLLDVLGAAMGAMIIGFSFPVWAALWLSPRVGPWLAKLKSRFGGGGAAALFAAPMAAASRHADVLAALPHGTGWAAGTGAFFGFILGSVPKDDGWGWTMPGAVLGAVFGGSLVGGLYLAGQRGFGFAGLAAAGAGSLIWLLARLAGRPNVAKGGDAPLRQGANQSLDFAQAKRAYKKPRLSGQTRGLDWSYGPTGPSAPQAAALRDSLGWANSSQFNALVLLVRSLPGAGLPGVFVVDGLLKTPFGDPPLESVAAAAGYAFRSGGD